MFLERLLNLSSKSNKNLLFNSVSVLIFSFSLSSYGQSAGGITSSQQDILLKNIDSNVGTISTDVTAIKNFLIPEEDSSSSSIIIGVDPSYMEKKNLYKNFEANSSKATKKEEIINTLSNSTEKKNEELIKKLSELDKNKQSKNLNKFFLNTDVIDPSNSDKAYLALISVLSSIDISKIKDSSTKNNALASKSIINSSLLNMLFNREKDFSITPDDKTDKNLKSKIELMKEEAVFRLRKGTKDKPGWVKKIQNETKIDNLVKELLFIEANRNYMAYESYRQNERMEAMLAMMLMYQLKSNLMIPELPDVPEP